MDSGYDRDRKRPLEIRILDRRDEGGISENKAEDSKGVTADAFLLMRVLVEEAGVAISFAAIEGWTAGPMSFDALFNLWLALTSNLAERKVDREDQEKLRLFAERVLNLMRLDVKLNKLKGDVAAEKLEN